MRVARVSRWAQPFVDAEDDEPINVTPGRHQPRRPRSDSALRDRIDAFHDEQAAKAQRLSRCSLQGWALSALFFAFTYSTLPGPHVLGYFLGSLSGGLALYAWFQGKLAREFSRMEVD